MTDKRTVVGEVRFTDGNMLLDGKPVSYFISDRPRAEKLTNHFYAVTVQIFARNVVDETGTVPIE